MTSLPTHQRPPHQRHSELGSQLSGQLNESAAQIDLTQYDGLMATPFATIGVRASADHLLEIRFLPAHIKARAPRRDSIAHLAITELSLFLQNPSYIFSTPLKLNGTKHELDVWQAMRSIPVGQARTYGDIAKQLGSSAQAVGTACGRNPIPLIVPCHRIIGANGLGGFMGYGAGDTINIKRWLLQHEGYLQELRL
jgi:methylated-DNA-[protein]-cysteine S-methyltransferase